MRKMNKDSTILIILNFLNCLEKKKKEKEEEERRKNYNPNGYEIQSHEINFSCVPPLITSVNNDGGSGPRQTRAFEVENKLAESTDDRRTFMIL